MNGESKNVTRAKNQLFSKAEIGTNMNFIKTERDMDEFMAEIIGCL
jgi:hypothetical protein